MSGKKLSSYHTCHSGQRAVIEVGDITLYAGGRNRTGGWHRMDPLADLAMGPSETLGSSAGSSTTVPEGWSCGGVLPDPPLFISFDWPDFSIPKVDKEFWYALIEDIKNHDIKTISCQCAGGHGRTGVQLAILAYLLSPKKSREEAWPTAYDLIMFVRAAHCDHAVEAKSQQEYIAMVCDIPSGKATVVEKSYTTIGGGGFYNTGYSFGGNDIVYDDDEFDLGEQEATLIAQEMEQLFEEGPKEKCPVCDGEDIDYAIEGDPSCNDCYTNLNEWGNQMDEMMCLCTECGGYFSEVEVVWKDGVCHTCYGRSLGMKGNNDFKLKCTGCKKFVPHIKFFKTNEDSTKCEPCLAGRNDKKRKPKKKSKKKGKGKKPKTTLDDFKDDKYPKKGKGA